MMFPYSFHSFSRCQRVNESEACTGNPRPRPTIPSHLLYKLLSSSPGRPVYPKHMIYEHDLTIKNEFCLCINLVN
jgi:hypothetical protein